MAELGAGPRVDSDGQQICQLCPVRLSRAKGKLHRHDPGRICTPCYNKRLRDTSVQPVVSPTAAQVTPRKRRAQSDPGESPESAPSPAITRRITPPKPTPASKKQRAEQREEQIMRLLDETHAQRMAAEQAAAATGGKRGATHTGFALTFVP